MSQHFTMGALLRFTGPSIATTIFISLYGIVDGFFVSNYVGATALAAVNFTFPIFLMLGTIGYMMGTGGSVLVAKTFGEGKPERANKLFSLFVYVSIGAGVLFTICGQVFLHPLLELLGAQGAMLDDCLAYGYVLMIGLTFDILMYIFESLVMTAGQPKLGLGMTIAAGLTNIGLDFLFIAVFGWGVAGAGWATAAGCIVGGTVPLVYFMRTNSTPLRLGRAIADWRALGRAASNGLSEMVTNISTSLVSVVFNVQLINLMGESGVAVYGVIAYVALLFAGAFIGFATGCAPLMSFQYGAQKTAEMNSLFKKSFITVGVFGVSMLVTTRLLAHPIAQLFVGYDEWLMQYTEHAFMLYSSVFLIMGFNIYGTSLFTALNNGLVSALLAFVRTLVFEIIAILVLPVFLGVDGIWLAVPIAETAALGVTVFFIWWLAPKYGVLPDKSIRRRCF